MELINFELSCFKTYDIRGRLGIDLDESIAYSIGAAFAVTLEVKTVVLGRDVQASSEELASNVAQVDLSRFDAAPITHLSYLSFEGQGAFPAEG